MRAFADNAWVNMREPGNLIGAQYDNGAIQRRQCYCCAGTQWGSEANRRCIISCVAC